MIGGQGKRFTLPLVVRLADICNVFGGVEELQKVFAEIDDLCRDVSRDPRTLWRTQNKPIAVGPSSEAAHHLWSKPERSAMAASSMLTGSRKEVAEALRPYLDVGLDGVTAILPIAAHTPEHVERVAEAVLAAF
jgi:alkanesulfonate monooxygenase SsuD/methylene tetrahydromethanopterin reductase-like flavin-dependent oxidoreductase (luciferase family)